MRSMRDNGYGHHSASALSNPTPNCDAEAGGVLLRRSRRLLIHAANDWYP